MEWKFKDGNLEEAMPKVCYFGYISFTLTKHLREFLLKKERLFGLMASEVQVHGHFVPLYLGL